MFVPVQTMQVYKRSVSPLILNFGMRRDWKVNSTPLLQKSSTHWVGS